jgi:hypothetical protein
MLFIGSDRQQTQTRHFPIQNGLNEVFRTLTPIINSSFTCSQTLYKNMIIGSTCQERQLLWPSSIELVSDLKLSFEKQITGISVRRLQFGERHHLLMSSRIYSNNDQFDDKPELISLLRTVCSQIQNDVLSAETTQTFPEMVKALQQTSKNNIQSIWTSVESGEICSSTKLRDLFLDASALASSEGSIEVLVNTYKKGKISKERSSYLFALMAFTSHSDKNSLTILLPLLRSSETPRQMVLGISGLIRNLKAQQKLSQQNIKQSIDAIVERIESSRNSSEIISSLKCLENIGIGRHSEAKQLLISLAQNSSQKQGVRISAINVLTESSDNEIREQLIQLFEQESENNELRISAYKSIVMSGPSMRQLEQIRDFIRNESNENIVNYVRSHQKNLRQNPHKRDVLPINAPEFESPKNELHLSRNLEMSYFHESTQIGIAVEADLVFSKQSKIPNSLTFNVSVPAFGKSIEVNVRQLGLDSVIQEKIKRSFGNLSKMVKEIVELFTEVETIKSRAIVLQFNLKIDGKTVLFLDAKDLETDFLLVLQQLKHHLEERIQIDRAFAIIPVNTRIKMPTSNGFPLTLRLNTTLVSGLKADLKLDGRQMSSAAMEVLVLPSIAVQIEAAVEFEVKNEKKSLELISRISSSLVLDMRTKIRDGRILNVKINVPKDKQSLVKVEERVYERDQSGQKKSIRAHSQENDEICSKSLEKPFGKFCLSFEGF